MTEVTDLSLLNFPEKLWYMVNEPDLGHIHWNAEGTTIIIPNNHQFVSKVLNNPSKILFKTKNFSSFIRQLNLYGFRKVSTNKKVGQAQPVSSNTSEFKHPSFKRDRKDLLEDIKRHTSTNKKEESPSEEKPKVTSNDSCMRRHNPVDPNPPPTMTTLGNSMWTNWDPFQYTYPWMPYGGVAGGYNVSNPAQYQVQGYYGKDGMPYYLPSYVPMPSYSYEEEMCAVDASRVSTLANESKVPVACPVAASSQSTSSGDTINISLSASVSTGNGSHGNTRESKSGVRGNLGNTFLHAQEEAKKPIPAQTAKVSTTSNNGAANTTDLKSSNKPLDVVGLDKNDPVLSNKKTVITNTKDDMQKGLRHDTGSVIQDYKRMKFMK